MRNGIDHLNGWFARLGERRTLVLCGLAALAAVTYLPFLDLPPMQDDYLQVDLSERYGAPSGWAKLLHDPLYRCRATSILLTAATMHLFGWSNLAFHLTGISLHVLNVLLIAGLGVSRRIGWPISLVAAFVFAVRERHHEAVIWYGTLHEPLVLCFSLLAVLSLIRWLEGGRGLWLSAMSLAWIAALASKESGVVLAAILPAVAWLYPDRRQTTLWLAAAGAVATAAYFLLAFGQKSEHQHFNDGTFSFGVHFVPVILGSAARGLWIWGGLALISIVAYRRKVDHLLLSFGAVWFVCGLAPYSFLTYMPRIPSRHHYVASVGMALIVAVAFGAFIQTRRRQALLAAALGCVFVAHNWGYLWTSKKPQFERRASLIEGFVSFVAERPDQPVTNRCHDLNSGEARRAIHYRLGLDPVRTLPDWPGADARVYVCPPPGS